MRIAIIADIHGNMPALEAVLDDLCNQRVDEVLLGGDLVGRGPEGSRVVRRLRELGWPGVRGNHEEYLLNFRRGNVPEHWLHDEQWAALRWIDAELDRSDVDYLNALPFALAPRGAPELCLVHGSPRSTVDGLGPWSTDEQLERHLESIEGRVLLCGHTHRPMERRLGNGLVVNVGAVGLPFNADQRAQYAILERGRAGWEVTFRRVPYDVGRILKVYDRSGFLEQGGVTARLLRLELEHASPFLVPFLKWADARGRPADSSQVEAFLEFYDPSESMRGFLERLADGDC